MGTPIRHDRRRFAACLGLLSTGLFVRPALADPTVRRDSRVLMGTRVDIVAQGAQPLDTDAAIGAAFAEMQRLERMMSRYRADSLVSALHRGAGLGAVNAPPELIAVLKRAAEVSTLSEGAFDITVGAYDGWSFAPDATRVPSADELRRARPLVDFRDVLLHERSGEARLAQRGMRIDLGGVAKLPILQAGLQVLQQRGVRHAMVNGGGDVLVVGQLQGRDWRIGVRDPRAPERLLGTVSLSDGVVASSGDYERCFVRDGQRYHHVLDPRTGRPTQGVHGVVTVSRTIHEVNGLGAATMVAGAPAGQRLLASLRDVDSLIVDGSSQVWTSGQMAKRLSSVA